MLEKEILLKKMKFRYITTGAVLTIFLIISLLYNFNFVDKTTNDFALTNARAKFKRDVIFRRWASSSGGLYAPIEKVKPNPFLSEYTNRDIIASNGLKLTLVNPAYIMRLVYEIEERESNVTNRIISLKPLNPDNKPDSLEEVALKQFEKGEKEFYVVTKDKHQKEIFKYIAPLITEKECLNCHSKQGYKVGDIRGAISLAMPDNDYMEHKKSNTLRFLIPNLVIWALGLLFLGLMYKIRKRQYLLLLVAKDNYKILTELSPAAIAVHQNGKFVFANKKALEVFEVNSIDEIIGKDVLSILHPNYVELAKSRMTEMIKGSGNVPPAIEKIISSKGNIKTIETTAAIINFDGKKAILTIARDLTELNKAYDDLKIKETQLRASEEKFRLFFENNEAVILLINPANGQIVDANKAASAFYGWSIEELTKMNINEINTLSPEEIKIKMAEARKREQNYFVFQHRLKNGEIRDVEVYQSKLSLDSDELFSIIIHDITERKKAENALKESENKFKQLFQDHVAVKLLIDSEDGKIVDANKAAEKFYGWSIEELKKMKISDINTLTPAEIKQKMEYAKQNKQNFFEFKHRLANGEIRDTAVYSSAISLNQKLYLHSIITDITARKQAEEKIKQNEKFLDYLIDTIPIPIFFKDKQGIYFRVNKAFANMYGAKKEDIIGKDISNLYRADFADIYQTKDKELYILGGKQVYETKFITNDGKEIYVVFHKSLFYEANGEVAGIIGAMIDITHIKKTEAELLKAKEKAEESDRLKSLFLANVSHEIRTPMNGILGFSQLLKDPNTKEKEIKEYIELIEKSGKRMLNIINDIIDISKIEANQMQVVIAECDLNEQTRFIYSFFRPEILSKGLELSLYNGLPDNESVVLTDKEKIYACLLNLIKNAIKFTNSGKISFGYIKKGELLEFFVKDTGSGIPAEKLGIIFDRFVQADLKISKPYKGAGLGLSITKGYVELLGGTIWAESEIGKGSTFYFTIPYKPVAKEVKEEKNANNYIWEGEKMKKLKILIAEDDITSDMLLTSIFKRYDCEIVHTQNGKEAVAAFEKSSDFDLVLMDLKMPEMDGYKATKLIKEINPKVVVIAQTAYALQGDREKAIAAGCDEYITKPIDQNILLDLIKKYY